MSKLFSCNAAILVCTGKRTSKIDMDHFIAFIDPWFKVFNIFRNIVTQVKRVTGTIIDETGEPMIGVSVLVQGTTTGTVTDLDG